MKAFYLFHVLFLILIKCLADETITNCESKVELRAVLLSCPVKDTGCDDDDPLSQAMAIEEAQILQTSSKNYRSIKEEKERGFPNAVKDCKRKLIITMKVKNSGRIPCDDEYIVIDHVFDPLTGGRGRLLTPVVLKLRQEQMIQLYGLQFQRVVNSDPFEEEKEADNSCSVDPHNPTCGIATYHGKPIPFSEGFCCSCDPQVNTKRQLSSVSRGDSFIYRDSKLIWQGKDRFSDRSLPEGFPSGAIVDPNLVKLKGDSTVSAKEEDEKDEKCQMKGLSSNSLPNYLIEHDRKIVCNQGDFLEELDKLKEEKNRGDHSSSVSKSCKSDKAVLKANPTESGSIKEIKLDKISPKVVSVKEKSDLKKSNPLHDEAVLKNLIGVLGTRKTVKSDSHSAVDVTQVSRKKRENRETYETFFTESEKKLPVARRNVSSDCRKNLLANRGKRLFEVPRERFRKSGNKFRRANKNKLTLPKFPRDNYAKPSPPKFFFSHDKHIVNPEESNESVANSTCRSSEDVEGIIPGDARHQKYQQQFVKGKSRKFSPEKDIPALFNDKHVDKTSKLLHQQDFKKFSSDGILEKESAIGKPESENEDLLGKFQNDIFKSLKNRVLDKRPLTNIEKEPKEKEEINERQNSEGESLEGDKKKEGRENEKGEKEFQRDYHAAKSIMNNYLPKENVKNQLLSRAPPKENERVDTGINNERPRSKVDLKSVDSLNAQEKAPNPEQLLRDKELKYRGQLARNQYVAGNNLRKYYKGVQASINRNRPRFKQGNPSVKSDEGNMDFNFEIIRKPIPPYTFPKFHARPEGDGEFRNRFYGSRDDFFANLKFDNNLVVGKNHQNRHFRHRDQDSTTEIKSRQHSDIKPQLFVNRLQPKFDRQYHRNPSKYYHIPTMSIDPYRREMMKSEINSFWLQMPKEKASGGKFRPNHEAMSRIPDSEEALGQSEAYAPKKKSLKFKRANSEHFPSEHSPDFMEKFNSCTSANLAKLIEDGDVRLTTETLKLGLDKISDNEFTKTLARNLSSFTTSKSRNIENDKERLQRSYAGAPHYVIKKRERGSKGQKRQAGVHEEENSSRINSHCEKNSFKGQQPRDTAHCMRFGDLWYSVYIIKKPVIAQIVGIQLFDKHGLCDGTTQWRDLTKGKMIRIGTFLPKAEDDLPTISMTYVGGKTKKSATAIDPDNYLLLIPSHLSDPSRASYYPQFGGGPEEYLVVDSKYVSAGGDCDMIGTSFEAFARQPDRCSRPRGTCLNHQPVDLWREDMEARIRGKRGKYFVENFGTVPNSPIKTYTNLTGEFLALEYYGEYTSTIEIEVKADFNAMVRKGSNGQIPAVYIDGTYPKKTRIILTVLNIGLTSAYFRPRLGDCPPDLDPAWCPLEGPLVTIPPQQRHDFRLDLSGALPPNKIHVTVQVLNEQNKKIAYRKIIIKKGDRCICAFHCKCNCIGNNDGRTCHKLALEEYRGAGYIGPYPFRGSSSASASESIRSNLRVIFLTAVYVLLFMGVIKGILGIFCRRMGIAGVRVIVGPRKISKYYEFELECCPVLFDECGFPVHPTTCLPVQIVPLCVEVFINFLFFFLYPLRGIWFLITSLPCCTIVIEMFDSDSSGGNEGYQNEHNRESSSPLLSKNPQPTGVHYASTIIDSKQRKGIEYLPYMPYKGDDDPLEEDDTEFVLQEMKRYRKKMTLL